MLLPQKNFVALLAILFFSFIISCKNKPKQPEESPSATESVTSNDTITPPTDPDNLYFSVKGYFDDQWKNKGHLPYVLKKIVTVNGSRKDSSLVNWDSTFFNQIRSLFEYGDIGTPAMFGKYDFSYSEDNSLGSYNLSYFAKKPDLPSQKVVVSADAYNNLVRMLYVETISATAEAYQSHKLTYIPDKVIQIQAFKKTPNSKPEETLTVYRFP